MDEPFDRQTVLLSALQPGLGQLASGRTERAIILIALDLVFGALSGVLGVLLKVLTFGRRPIKALPDRLNPLALIWLAIYLYNLYDAYNIAAGADDDDADLLDYEEYTPGDTAEAHAAQAGSTNPPAGNLAPPAMVPASPNAPAATANRPVDGFTSTTPGTDAGAVGADKPADDTAAKADRIPSNTAPVTATQDLSVAPGTTAAHSAPATQAQDQGGTAADAAAASAGRVADEVAALQAIGGSGVGGPGVSRDVSGGNAGSAASSPATSKSGGSGAGHAPAFNFGETTLDWAAGVSKAQLLTALGDDPQVIGTFGNYLPADRLFHSFDEATDLIPEQAWQDAQGRNWTGADIPDGEEPSGYRESVTGQMPAGDTTA